MFFLLFREEGGERKEEGEHLLVHDINKLSENNSVLLPPSSFLIPPSFHSFSTVMMMLSRLTTRTLLPLAISRPSAETAFQSSPSIATRP